MYKRCIAVFATLFLLYIPVKGEEVTVSAHAAVVMEVDSGKVIYAKDAHNARPMASTTKLMTALLAAEALPLDTVITVSKEAVAVEGSSLGLRAGDTIVLSDLLTGLLLASGNDAANVTAEAVAGDLPAFASLMNAKAKHLGMENSGFVTPSGLDAEGHAASAYDMALLGRAVLRNDFLRQICKKQSAQLYFGAPPKKVWVKNHNRLLSLSRDCIGMKTGFTKKAGRCLVSAATREGVTIVVATLHASDDWNDHLRLYEYAFSRLKRITPQSPSLPPLAVAGGKQLSLPLVTPQPDAVTVESDAAEIQVTVQLPSFVWAPVKEGEAVGYVTYQYTKDHVLVLPITAAKAVVARPRSSLIERFWKNIQQAFMLFLK